MFAYAHLILASITSSHLYSGFSTALDFWFWRVHRHQSKNSRGRRSLFIDLFWPSSPRHLSPYPERSSRPSLGQSRQRLFSRGLRWSDERLGWWREGNPIPTPMSTFSTAAPLSGGSRIHWIWSGASSLRGFGAEMLSTTIASPCFHVRHLGKCSRPVSR